VHALALFLIGQIFVAAHAIEHGIEPHQHNGAVCLTVLNDDQEDLLPPIRLVALSIVQIEPVLLSVSNQVLFTKNLTQRPHSTGPPTI